MSIFDQRRVKDAAGRNLQTISPVMALVLKALEGLRLRGYTCAADEVTIGFGHTGLFSVDVQDKYGLPPFPTTDLQITEEAADEILEDDVSVCEAAVRALVTVPLKQHEFDALVSFVFNLGRGALASSMLLKMLNQERRAEAADEFLKWRLCKGEPLPALEKRRAVERHIFLTARYDETPYDGDLSDAIAPLGVVVDRPATEGREDIEKSRTIDSGRKAAGITAVLGAIAALKNALGDILGENVLAFVAPWLVKGIVNAAILGLVAWGVYQGFRVYRARMDDHLMLVKH